MLLKVKTLLRKIAWRLSSVLTKTVNACQDFSRWLTCYRLSKAIRQRTHELERQPIVDFYFGLPQDKLFLGVSYYISRPERLNMLSVAMPQSLASLKHSDLPIRVMDASEARWSEQARAVFERIPAINLEYHACPGSFTAHWLQLLQQAKEPYFGMLFDDQSIFGLTPPFLQAACQLLHDYRGLVDLVHIDYKYPYMIDPIRRTVYVDLDSPEWKQLRKTPLATVTYGGHTFDILEKWNYGFIADNIIASRSEYLRRLAWYLANVTDNSIHAIENAAADLRLGPIYHYYAVPQQVFFLDLDFHHTAAAVRGNAAHAKEIYQALRDGYTVAGKQPKQAHEQIPAI